ncbi:hypothetical protein OG417_23170 [Actinoallomurus sp. NBC_01490]|jgi:hypothetical protein|uniref:hypothetical protein n=1 Tax=Actinoallomurus sp. NBC_01490 TaxID=2903557 RepID=UPI002E360BBB|nr:hypothetical protein [Actinoallomurus sp. NBC_01490]
MTTDEPGGQVTPRSRMAFRPATAPIREPVAKLGGQPVWLDRPCWPVSRELGTPMMFAGQFPIPGEEQAMAYLFVTDDPDGVAATYEPEGGENALLVQPGGRVPEFLAVAGAPTGPSLWRRGATWVERLPVELHVDLAPLGPAEERALDEQIAALDAERDGVFLDAAGTDASPPGGYVGGRPRFWQPVSEMPAPWRFFFQIDGAEGWDGDPYALNFGGGTGYAYLAPDRREGRFFWDCV